MLKQLASLKEEFDEIVYAYNREGTAEADPIRCIDLEMHGKLWKWFIKALKDARQEERWSILGEAGKKWRTLKQAYEQGRKEQRKTLKSKLEIIKLNIDASQDFVHNSVSKKLIKEILDNL